MKIYNSIGSKDRLFEMMRNVNKMQLNEEVFETNNIILHSFEELKNGNLRVQKTNTLTSGNDTFVEIVGVDGRGNTITFRFKVTATESDQDGVYDINTATLMDFNSKDYQADENTDEVRRFNNEFSQEIVDVVSNYVDFEDETPEIDEEYLEAAKKIDSYPFGGTPRPMQTPKAYANEKPTNPKVRVKAPELDDEDKYVLGEMQTGKAYADEKPTNPAVRVKSPELDKYVDEEKSVVGNEPDNKIKIITTAINNLTTQGKSKESITTSDVNGEIQRMLSGGEAKLGESLADTTAQRYVKKRPLGEKLKAIEFAKTLVDKKLAASGISIEDISYERYAELVRIAANRILTRSLASMNEDEKEDDGMSFEPQGDEVEQVAQDREMEVGSEEESPLEYDPDQILAGLKIEMEENPDPMEALEVVMANLEEDPEYYDVSEEEPEEEEIEDDEIETEEEPEGEETEDDEEDFEVDKIDNVDTNDVEDDNIEVDNVDNPDDDKEMTDILLGYKSKNVGDDVEED
jgi:hypothetical protein